VNPLVEKAPPTKRPVQVARADKESQLSLLDGAFTRILPRVQPVLLLGLVGVIIYGLITVIHHTTNRTLILRCKWGLSSIRAPYHQ